MIIYELFTNMEALNKVAYRGSQAIIKFICFFSRKRFIYINKFILHR